ncbi:hypothetical protein PSAB6_60362 [Paraburkholderia sabiae]|nr:hypothetical protein PSAB6_60362 [Paraburkholderia sabiae]
MGITLTVSARAMVVRLVAGLLNIGIAGAVALEGVRTRPSDPAPITDSNSPRRLLLNLAKKSSRLRRTTRVAACM